MKKFHYFTFLIVAISTLTACKEDPPVPFCTEFPDECAEITGVKDYFYFKEGTWWVYEEETSGERDSVYVFHEVNDPDSYYFRTETYSTHNEYEYNYWSYGGIIDKGIIKKDGKGVKVKLSKTKPGDFVSESTCFIYFPALDDWTYSNAGQPIGYDNILKVEEFFDNYELENHFYNDVVLMSEEHTAADHQQPTLKYYAENLGLVRKELLDSNEVWNLVEYNIVK